MVLTFKMILRVGLFLFFVILSIFNLKYIYIYIYVFQKISTRTIFITESSNKNHLKVLSYDYRLKMRIFENIFS